MTVRLVDEQPCPTCGGSRYETAGTVDRNAAGLHGMKVARRCTACGGTGVRVSPVSCAGCRYWNQGYYCSKTDTFNCGPDHGCKLWTAKEATGNG